MTRALANMVGNMGPITQIFQRKMFWNMVDMSTENKKHIKEAE